MQKNEFLLVADAGNTETVIGIYENSRLFSHFRISSKIDRTDDEFWMMLQNWFHFSSIDSASFSGAAISSVVPSITDIFIRVMKRKYSVMPLVITPKLDIGIHIQYSPPEAVGADRLCNAVAGLSRYRAPLIIVDFGTATTFDVIAENNIYMGGIIALGIHGASKGLHKVSAKLPSVTLEFPEKIIGANTEASMQSGILWGTAAMIDGLIEKISHELNCSNITAIATGGLSVMFEKRCASLDAVEPFLTLEGIRLIYNNNK